jgi:hypothetical protein
MNVTVIVLPFAKNINVRENHRLLSECIEIFWAVTPYRLVNMYQRFETTYCLHLQG